MTQKKFLVTGATGATGGYAVGRLLERGHAVRALAHREDDRSKRLQELGAEVVIGDLLKLNDVRLALSGIRGAYFVYPLSPTLVQATAIFAQAAKEAAYSTPNLPLIPRQTCHPFHTKVATDSMAKLPPNPGESCH